MQIVIRRVVAAVVSGGVPLLAYGVLVPGVWSRETLGPLQGFAGLSAALALLHGPAGEPLGAWARMHLVNAAGALAGLLSAMVTLSLAFGDDVLTSTSQRLFYGLALVGAVLVLGHFWRISLHGFPPRPDPERDARREAIRKDVRREIEEIERQARAARETPPPS